MATKGLTSVLATLAILAVIGAAVAMWSETLYVNVTVNTGEVDVAFVKWSCSDVGPDPQAEGFRNTEGKNVASCSVTVEQRDGEEDVIKLLVTISNAYPGYTVDVTLVVKNVGTIPVKLLSSEVEFDEPIVATLIVPEDTQIDPGCTATYTLRITVPQEAAEQAEYAGKVTLVFAQWNEV